LYETAVVVKRRIAGIPILTLLGAATFIYLIFSGYLSVASGYPVTIWTAVTWIIIFGSGAAIYLIGYSRAKRRGIPIEFVFKEIPPE
jgi:uncharacterized membrane protein